MIDQCSVMLKHVKRRLCKVRAKEKISNASTSVVKGCELRSGWKVISRDVRHPGGDISVGREGSQLCTNPLPLSHCRCSIWVTSPLEHHLRNSRLSLTQAHLTWGCPPSFAPVQSVVSTDPLPGPSFTCPATLFPLLARNDTHLLCLQLERLCSDIFILQPSSLPKRSSASSTLLEGWKDFLFITQFG